MSSESDIKVHDHENGITRIPTAEVFNETASRFEARFLAPEAPVKGELRRTFANPTPVAICGFLLANTPASIQLMGWRGAGGATHSPASTTAVYYWFGGLLLVLGGIGEFLLGNTFPCVVFLSFGGFWLSFGGTLTPYYAAISSYSDEPAAFYNSFVYFLIFMGLLCLFYLICAFRTNICLVLILLNFVLAFGFLSAAYWYAADGRSDLSISMLEGGGATAFVASCVAWYLWLTMLLESVDFPIQLPVGDLSTIILGKHEKELKSRRAGMGA